MEPHWMLVLLLLLPEFQKGSLLRVTDYAALYFDVNF